VQNAAVDLARSTVLVDFDGTISVADTSMFLLERLGTPGWEIPEDLYQRGVIGSRECIARQWRHLPPDEDLLRATARLVPLDPGFGPLVEFLRDAGAGVVVVSDGFGFHAEEACAPFGVEVVTNRVDFSAGSIGFPNADPSCLHGGCATCKRRVVIDTQQKGRTVVVVGDGSSDREAARVADIVFAKHPLADWCAAEDIRHIRFSTLTDVRQALAGRTPEEAV
jgi:2,3-diketo-5-methylthio-1-phosphopentane phosphatase